MSFKLFKDVVHWSKNDLYGWSNTWQSFIEGRWFSVSGNRFPNSFDDRTGNFKLHPATVKKLIREGYVEELEYADKNSRIARGSYNEWATKKPQIKLRLTEKGQALAVKEPTMEELQQRVHDLEAQLSTAFEIMTDRQIADNQHLFQESIDIGDSAKTNQTRQGDE